MSYDAADLALLEITIPNFADELTRRVLTDLVAHIRENEERVEAAELALSTAQDHAKDGEIALDHLRQHIKEAPAAADGYADQIESALDDIRCAGA